MSASGASDTSSVGTFDVFLSYAHQDKGRVQPLVDALRKLGVGVWFDETDIVTFEGITRSIFEGLAKCKGLLAFYSTHYPTRRACQCELTAAFLATQQDGDPRKRVWVVNPEPRANHIEPIELRDAHFASLPEGADTAAYCGVARAVYSALAKFTTPLSAVRPITPPPWYGAKGFGSNRFVGRIRSFWELHSILFACDNSIITAEAAGGLAQVRAMGGVGKSLLAEEYALRFGAAYPGGVFVLRGTIALDEQLAGFASSLGLDVQGLDPDCISGWLERHLRASGKRYLWWVDDFPGGLSEESRRRWWAPNAIGKTLITTRSREYGSTGGVLDLGVLDATEGYELLTKQRQPEDATERQAAEELVAELGGHALALDVAGGALHKLKGRETFVGFLARVRAPGPDVLAAAAELRPELPNGHDRSITATLSTSIGLLEESGRDVLRLGSLLAPEVIPNDIVDGVVAQSGSNSPWGAASIVDAVVNHCLADAVRTPEGTSGYIVHALVARTIRFYDKEAVGQHLLPDVARLPSRTSALRTLAVRALLRSMPAVEDARAHSRMRIHVVHARHLAASPSTSEEITLLGWVATHDQLRGWYASARAHGEVLLEAVRRLQGDQHPDTLKARSNLAQALFRQGDLAGARAHEEALLGPCRRLLGNDHPDTLTTRLNLAQTLYAQGDLKGARVYQEAVLEARRRVLGNEHRDTLKARNNLAGTLCAQGDLAGALTHHEAVLEAYRRLLGEEHPDTLIVRSNLGGTLAMQGHLAGARRHQEVVLDARRRLLGDEHPDTLVERNNLAHTLYRQGELALARGHQEAVLESMRRLVGEEHPQTLGARGNLALTLHAQGDLAAARVHQEAVLEACRRSLGEEHPDTLIGRNNLAGTLYAQGDLVGARGHQEATLQAMRARLGDQHPFTLTVLNELAKTLKAQVDLAGARARQELGTAGRSSKARQPP